MKKYANRLEMISDLSSGIGAEIGVHRGEFAAQMLGLPNVQFLHLIDPWLNDPTWRSDLNGQDQEANLAATKSACNPFEVRFRIWRVTSREVALGTIAANNNLDWVYIDARHDFESVLEDLYNWSKISEILMGHDFCRSELQRKHNWGVVEAVEEFLRKNINWHLEAITTEEIPSFQLKRLPEMTKSL